MGAGASENPVLLSAAVTEFELSQNEDQVPGKTSYYIVEESIGLQNPDDIPSEVSYFIFEFIYYPSLSRSVKYQVLGRLKRSTKVKSPK